MIRFLPGGKSQQGKVPVRCLRAIIRVQQPRLVLTTYSGLLEQQEILQTVQYWLRKAFVKLCRSSSNPATYVHGNG